MAVKKVLRGIALSDCVWWMPMATWCWIKKIPIPLDRILVRICREHYRLLWKVKQLVMSCRRVDSYSRR